MTERLLGAERVGPVAGLSAFFRSEAAQTVRREGRTEGREEGHAETQAKNIVTVLERRGLAVPDAVRERVLSCRDGALLDVWWERVFDVAEAVELLSEGITRTEPSSS